MYISISISCMPLVVFPKGRRNIAMDMFNHIREEVICINTNGS